MTPRRREQALRQLGREVGQDLERAADNGVALGVNAPHRGPVSRGGLVLDGLHLLAEALDRLGLVVGDRFHIRTKANGRGVGDIGHEQNLMCESAMKNGPAYEHRRLGRMLVPRPEARARSDA